MLTREDAIQRFEDVIDQITVFVGSVAGISLVVGSIGIANIMIVTPTDWIAIAVAVGITVGIVSGLYPAWRAARVDPIEALRHE